VLIGLLSDTHGAIDQKMLDFFANCDEIWHAGDIGDTGIIDILGSIAPVRAVCGNIDGHELRAMFPLHQRFICEGMDVWMTHIGGYPGHYAPQVREAIYSNPPGLFISGHSHIVKVMPDKQLHLMHINPGAAGIQGIHQVRTVMRFKIENASLHDLEMFEINRKRSL